MTAGFAVTFHYVILAPRRWDGPRVDTFILDGEQVLFALDGLEEGRLDQVINNAKGARPSELGAREVRPPIDLGRASRLEEGDDEPLTGTFFAYATYGNSGILETDYASVCIIASPPGHGLGWHNWPSEPKRKGCDPKDHRWQEGVYVG